MFVTRTRYNERRETMDFLTLFLPFSLSLFFSYFLSKAPNEAAARFFRAALLDLTRAKSRFYIASVKCRNTEHISRSLPAPPSRLPCERMF